MDTTVPQTGGCAQAMAEGEPPPVVYVPSTPDNRPRSMERDFIFVEQPSQDFFCPVSLELLLEPQQTSCCGHHLSLEAATRLQSEGKACPLCNGAPCWISTIAVKSTKCECVAGIWITGVYG